MDARSHVTEAKVVIDNSARLPRRGFLSAASLAAAAIGMSAPSLAAFAADAPPPVTTETMGKPWTRDRYNQAMAESDAIQARKPAAMKMIAGYLDSHFGKVDPLVMAAFEQVPREYYHYMYQNRIAAPAEAYESTPKPWAIGYGSALSDYLGQAYMTQLLQPKPGMVSLEVGTGSGFQSSLLSRIVSKSYSIEIIEPLGHAVSHIFKPLGYDNIETKVGDGYYGWPEVSEGFDVIIVTCAAEYAPPDLFKQLKPRGRMIIPIGQPFKRGQVLYVYTKDENGKIHSRRDVGVFFIPMTGAIQKTPKAT
jgi:protein-L-isoaspartate(D-aspartate) O-methyltransferase